MVPETGDAALINVRPYHFSVDERKLMKNHLDEMLAKGVTQSSMSPWDSFANLVRKAGSLKGRFAIDYCMMNKVTKNTTPAYPLPRIDEVVDLLNGAQWFGTTDQRSGYRQMAVHNDSIPKTAFNACGQLFAFLTMPFGLAAASAAFQSSIHVILSGMVWPSCLAYLEDVLIFFPSVEQHLNHLEEDLERFLKAGLVETQRSVMKNVRILDFDVSLEGVLSSRENTQAIISFPRPQKRIKFSHFLGTMSYFRGHVRNFITV